MSFVGNLVLDIAYQNPLRGLGLTCMATGAKVYIIGNLKENKKQNYQALALKTAGAVCAIVGTWMIAYSFGYEEGHSDGFAEGRGPSYDEGFQKGIKFRDETYTNAMRLEVLDKYDVCLKLKTPTNEAPVIQKAYPDHTLYCDQDGHSLRINN